MPAITVKDPRGDAELAQRAHTDLAKMVMGSIELLDLVLSGKAKPEIAAVREGVDRQLRRSIIDHAIAIASLVADSAPDYAEDLTDYVESFVFHDLERALDDQEGGDA